MRKPSRPIDISWLTEIVQRVGHQPSIEVGLVQPAEDGGDHFDADGKDVLLEVELVPSGRHVACRLMAAGGGPAQGVWSIPPVGAEVVVGLPNGTGGDEYGVIIGTLSTGRVPTGTGPTVILIVPPPGGTVQVRRSDGTAEALVLKSDFDGHTHGPGTFANGSGAVTGASAGADDAAGTTVLKAQ